MAIVAAAAGPYTAQAQLRATDRARNDVRRAAMYLAQMGLSTDTIRESMLDMCATATAEAVRYVERYEAAEARELAADREDYAESCRDEARAEHERELQERSR